MKKEELRAALGKIRPREELVNDTLAKIKKEKERKERRFVFTPSFSKGMRLAGALCAFALVFCIGFVVARQNDDTPAVDGGRSVIELDTNSVTNVPDVSSFSVGEEDNGNYLIVKGTISAFRFAEIDETDAENGVLYRCLTTVNISNLESKSENFPLSTVLSELEAEVLFYDVETLNYYMDVASDEMIYRLSYDDENGWRISDIFTENNK